MGIVLQFNVVNTIDSQLLRDCKVEFEDPDYWNVVATVPAPWVSYQQPGKTYVRCQANVDLGLECFQASAISAELLFFQCECDPTSGEILDEEDEGMDDQYPVESFEIDMFDDIQSAVPSIIDTLGMTACDGTSAVAPRAKKHMVLLAGTFSNGQMILARASLQQ